jgi:hypothetical protein
MRVGSNLPESNIKEKYPRKSAPIRVQFSSIRVQFSSSAI